MSRRKTEEVIDPSNKAEILNALRQLFAEIQSYDELVPAHLVNRKQTHLQEVLERTPAFQLLTNPSASGMAQSKARAALVDLFRDVLAGQTVVGGFTQQQNGKAVIAYLDAQIGGRQSTEHGEDLDVVSKPIMDLWVETAVKVSEMEVSHPEVNLFAQALKESEAIPNYYQNLKQEQKPISVFRRRLQAYREKMRDRVSQIKDRLERVKNWFQNITVAKVKESIQTKVGELKDKIVGAEAQPESPEQTRESESTLDSMSSAPPATEASDMDSEMESELESELAMDSTTTADSQILKGLAQQADGKQDVAPAPLPDEDQPAPAAPMSLEDRYINRILSVLDAKSPDVDSVFSMDKGSQKNKDLLRKIGINPAGTKMRKQVMDGPRAQRDRYDLNARVEQSMLKGFIKDLFEELNGMQEDQKDAQKTLDLVEKRLKEVSETVGIMEGQVQKLTLEHDKAIRFRDSTQQNIESAEQRIEVATQKLAELAKNPEAKEADRVEVQQELDTAKRILQTHQDNSITAEDDIKLTEKNLQEAKDQLAEGVALMSEIKSDQSVLQEMVQDYDVRQGRIVDVQVALGQQVSNLEKLVQGVFEKNRTEDKKQPRVHQWRQEHREVKAMDRSDSPSIDNDSDMTQENDERPSLGR